MDFPLPPHTQALNSTTFTPAPLDGSLTLPEICDWHLSHSPKHPLFVYAEQFPDKTEILWDEGVKAIHRAAHVINSAVDSNGLESTSFTPPVVAMFAASGASSKCRRGP